MLVVPVALLAAPPPPTPPPPSVLPPPSSSTPFPDVTPPCSVGLGHTSVCGRAAAHSGSAVTVSDTNGGSNGSCLPAATAGHPWGWGRRRRRSAPPSDWYIIGGLPLTVSRGGAGLASRSDGVPRAPPPPSTAAADTVPAAAADGRSRSRIGGSRSRDTGHADEVAGRRGAAAGSASRPRAPASIYPPPSRLPARRRAAAVTDGPWRRRAPGRRDPPHPNAVGGGGITHRAVPPPAARRRRRRRRPARLPGHRRPAGVPPRRLAAGARAATAVAAAGHRHEGGSRPPPPSPPPPRALAGVLFRLPTRRPVSLQAAPRGRRRHGGETQPTNGAGGGVPRRPAASARCSNAMAGRTPPHPTPPLTHPRAPPPPLQGVSHQ